MKNILGFSMLLLLLLAFKPMEENSYYRNDGYLLAVIEGKNFDLRDNDKYHAELLYKTSSMGGGNSLKKEVAASINFYGVELKDEKGTPFNEKLVFEYSFNEGALGEVSNLKIDLKQDRKDYSQLPEDNKFNITSLTWAADRRSFVMSADFDCQLRKFGFPAESQPVVRLKGKMENITVSVPAWINVKNPTQQAEYK